MSPDGIATDSSVLTDADGPIPTFPPRRFDARGRLLPLSPEELQARARAAIRAIKAIRARPDSDPPGVEAEFMRGIDENRPAGHGKFQAFY